MEKLPSKEPDAVLDPAVEANLNEIRRTAGRFENAKRDETLTRQIVEKWKNEKNLPVYFEKWIIQALNNPEKREQIMTYRTPGEESDVRPHLERFQEHFNQYLQKEPQNRRTRIDDWDFFKKVYEDFLTLETQTWLDVAFIQAATRRKFMRAGAIQQTMEVARFLFGEDSRIEKTLEEYVKRGRIKMKGVIMTILGAIMAPAVVIQAIKYEENRTVGNMILLLVSVAISFIGAIIFYVPVEAFWKNSIFRSRAHTREYYEKFSVPPEVERFVELAFAIHELVKKSQQTADATQRAAIMKELESLTEEAKTLLRENQKLFSALAGKEPEANNTAIPREKSNRRIEAEVRDEEFEESAEAPENAGSITAPSTAHPFSSTVPDDEHQAALEAEAAEETVAKQNANPQYFPKK